MKNLQIIVLSFFASIVAMTSATITIQYPSAQYYWVEGQSNQIIWSSGAGDSQSFSIYLINKQRPELSQLALQTNVQTNLGNTSITMTSFLGVGFQLLFTDPLNTTSVLAQSDNFEIKANGTTPSVYTPPPPTPSTTPTPSASVGSKKSSSNSIHNYDFSILVLITLFTINLF